MQYLHQAQLLCSLFNRINNEEKIDIILLINYTSVSGYQICLYKDGEIFINPKNFKNVNKNESIDKNIKLIAEEIKKYEKKRRIDILLTESIDTEENEYNVEKISELIKKELNIIDEDDSNFLIKKLGKEFNGEVSCDSHIFYLD